MRGFVFGVFVGFLLCAALVGAGAEKKNSAEPVLYPWNGNGARPGLYYAASIVTLDPKRFLFWECKHLGEGKVVPPASPSR